MKLVNLRILRSLAIVTIFTNLPKFLKLTIKTKP